MSLVSWFVVVLTGMVSTLSAVAIISVIALVLGQATLLLYRRLSSPRTASREGQFPG